MIDTAPIIWGPKEASFDEKGTAIIPQIPTTPWTDIAPTGSSIFNVLSRKTTEKYTITPPLLLDSNYNSVSDEIITEHTLKDNGDGTYEYIK